MGVTMPQAAANVMLAVKERQEIRPQPGPQEQALAANADLVFYGGAAGGGKTYALLLEPLRHIHNSNFSCVIFRRTYVQVSSPGGLWDTSMALYPHAGGVPRESDLEWRFPAGATIKFAHMQHATNRLDWQGAQIPLIEWDELSHFTKEQFFYLLSRNRSATAGIKPYIRATMNPVPPDDEIGGWLHEFVGWYLDADGYANSERCGVVRWFVMHNDTLRWADTPDELRALYPGLEPKSFTFIKSSVYDNPALLTANPGYIANLQALPLVEQERLLGDPERGGNWLVRPSAGKVFNRAWFEIVDAVPDGGRTVRFWDLAASEKKIAKGDPDFTASIKMKRVVNTYYVMDCFEERVDPAATDNAIRNYAGQDGRSVAIRWEEEGGASGKRDSRNIAIMLNGYDVRGIKPQGDKLVRARGLSSQALAGNVKLVRGTWNERWLTHMHGQPDLAHDDIMDASSGAYNELAGNVPRPASSRQG
jgi:predicted phage terminase large subunit-like protein